jgi:crotonobetainyl-CoA:carnitine CoA-transferase CaiB-like acyl-CoA transferase
MDKIAQAESGMMSIGPMIDQIALVDVTAGNALTTAIVGAVLKRERTGRGGRVNGRLFDAALLLQAPDIAAFSISGDAARATSVAGYPVADQFPTSDGAVFIAAYYDWHWRSLCGVLGLEELADDPRFRTRELRTQPEHATVLRAMLHKATSAWTRKGLTEALEEAGVMVTTVRDYAEVLADPQVALNQTLVDAPYRDGTVKLVRPPFDYDGIPTPVRRTAPEMGADTEEVLSEIGYSQEQINRLAPGQAEHR